jgi:hypothetical protein
MRKAKALGFNTVRMHVKIPDPRYLEIADEEGLLVWLDLPNHWTWTPDAARRLETLFDEWLARDWNHPSLAIVSLVNESWGVDLSQAEQRAWLLGFYERAKAAVPGWLVVDNSACWGNFHLKTDLADYHTYWAIPENRNRFEQTVWELAARPDWLFSPYGDAVVTGDEPVVLSEFGNWGLPNVPESLPWWLDHGMDELDVTIPTGVHDRFRDYGYDAVFGPFGALAEASQRMQARALRYEIETLRRTPGIAGYVVTELTDLHWESNGLMDMERNVKAGMDALAPIQQQDVVVPTPLRHAVSAGVEMDVRVAHFSGAAADSTVVQWTTALGDSGAVRFGPLAPGEIHRPAAVWVPFREIECALPVRVAFRWEDDEGRLLAENEAEVFAFPDVERARARVHNPDRRLGDVSYFIETDPTAGVLVAPTLDAHVLEHLTAGGRAIVFADGPTALPDSFPFRLVSREEELWDGNWVSNLNWVRHDRAPFAGIAFGPTLGFEAASVDLAHVVDGVPPEHFEDVLAGLFVGWVQRNAGYVVQMNVGAGRLLLVTMRPHAPPDDAPAPPDKYAWHLVRALVDYAGSDAFQPGLTWNP